MDEEWVRRIVIFLVIIGAGLTSVGAILFIITENNEGLFDSAGAIRPHVELAFRLIYFGVLTIAAATTIYFTSILLRADKHMRSH